VGQNGINVNLTDQYGHSPLLYAAKGGHEAIVRLLVTQESINVNLKDQDGHSTLSYAAKHGHETIVRLLLTQN